jgi:hypothetical protein
MGDDVAELYHLGVTPIWGGLFARGSATSPFVGRHTPVNLHQRFPVSAPTIRQQGRRAVTVGLPSFHLLPQVNRRFGFGLTDAASDPQAGGRFNQGAAPVFARFSSVYSVFFSCLRPTYVHSPSISARLMR